MRVASISKGVGSIRGQPILRPSSLRALHGEKPQTAGSTYLALGLAHCYEKTEEGSLNDKYVIEPISAASLECMAAGAKTSFQHVTGTTLGMALRRNKDDLPAQFSDGLFCEDYEFRCKASARTWLRPHAQDNLMDIVPFEQVKSNFNYKTDDKRVLNFENVVTDEDNVKQDMSIDVYGRAEKKEQEEAEEKAAAEAETQDEAEEEEEEDDLESFLAA